MKLMITFLSILALVMPGIPAQSRSITLGSCGDLPPIKLLLPAKAPKPGDGHDCCKKGCHAAPDRKKKTGENGCC